MSFQNFHRWGQRNKAEIEAVIRGDNYSGGATWRLNSGDTIWNETFEGTMTASANDNPTLRGTFTDGTMSIFTISTASGPVTYYERYWVQFINVGINGVPGAGGSDGEFGAGIAWTAPDVWPGATTGDLMTMQHSGTAYARYNGTFIPGNHVEADGSALQDGKFVDGSSTASTKDMGLQMNNQIGAGAITIKMNFSESR